MCNNFDTYYSESCSKLVKSDGYALTEGKRALERISVSLQEYNDNTVTRMSRRPSTITNNGENQFLLESTKNTFTVQQY